MIHSAPLFSLGCVFVLNGVQAAPRSGSQELKPPDRRLDESDVLLPAYLFDVDIRGFIGSCSDLDYSAREGPLVHINGSHLEWEGSGPVNCSFFTNWSGPVDVQPCSNFFWRDAEPALVCCSCGGGRFQARPPPLPLYLPPSPPPAVLECFDSVIPQPTWLRFKRAGTLTDTLTDWLTGLSKKVVEQVRKSASE